MSEEKFNFLVSEAVAQRQGGWDFSFVDGRMIEDPLPWSYVDLAQERLGKARAAVDQQTGGGELLSGVSQIPEVMFATEAYSPNLILAKARLQPLGIKVVLDDTELPGGMFDLVLNRHGSFQLDELRRIAKPRAIFLTQQVGTENLTGLNDALGFESVDNDWNPEIVTKQLETAGFEVLQCLEARPRTRFFDIGSVVFYLNAVPWQIPGFSVDRYINQLLVLHEHIERHGSFDAMAHRFLIEARRI